MEEIRDLLQELTDFPQRVAETMGVRLEDYQRLEYLIDDLRLLVEHDNAHKCHVEWGAWGGFVHKEDK
jgi:hypothetical protein